MGGVRWGGRHRSSRVSEHACGCRLWYARPPCSHALSRFHMSFAQSWADMGQYQQPSTHIRCRRVMVFAKLDGGFRCCTPHARMHKHLHACMPMHMCTHARARTRTSVVLRLTSGLQSILWLCRVSLLWQDTTIKSTVPYACIMCVCAHAYAKMCVCRYLLACTCMDVFELNGGGSVYMGVNAMACTCLLLGVHMRMHIRARLDPGILARTQVSSGD